MKIKTILISSIAWLLAACAEDVEQLAQNYLSRAQVLYANEQYHTAKLQLDSIKILYPTAFEARAKAQTMLLHIDLSDSQRNLNYIDSLLTHSYAKVQHLSPLFYLDKDVNYQDIGTYYASQYRTEKNIGRTYMRPQTDEKGVFSIVIFQRGKPLNPHTLRFTATDGTFIEIASPTSHSWADASGRTERIDFATTSISSIASFVEMHTDTNVKVELIGTNGKATIPFTKTDKQNLLDIADFAKHLHNICDLKNKQEETNRRIDFIHSRLQADSVRNTTRG